MEMKKKKKKFIILYSIFISLLCTVANRSELITKEILVRVFMIWHHEKLLPFTTMTTITTTTTTMESAGQTADEKDDEDEISSQNNRLRMSNFIFNNVISSRLMVMMVGRDERSFEVYGDFLVELMREKFITIEHVNELSIGLYKHEWNKVC